MRTILLAALDAASPQDKHTLFNALTPLVKTGSTDGYQLQLAALPYAFKRSLVVLEQLITQHKPAVLLLLAQDAAQTQISLEKVALNINHCLSPDQDNQIAKDSLTAQHGPAAYFSNLPLAALVSTLQQQQIPAQLSYHAGTGVANHAYYGLMHYIKHQNTNLQGALLKLPLLPEQACRLAGAASMSAKLTCEALTLVTQQCASNTAAIRAV
ncbi:pyroglutamyl-peptidase I family protein [Rheinheimera nanhaiensis]|uniref:Pyrrolidone-carboxylate peptidase n=1 Tax=Rheinheimera nanhaiensis E407-8 TaxID=562729 RepID=I1DUA1_9GAMM|nr:pyroglutamyl-peptidase [Rheinheimera nanhaiensis]GAB57629.1 pyroglutamyl-peptidase [Rheinheimera nanhaiensis E407-8]